MEKSTEISLAMQYALSRGQWAQESNHEERRPNWGDVDNAEVTLSRRQRAKNVYCNEVSRQAIIQSAITYGAIALFRKRRQQKGPHKY